MKTAYLIFLFVTLLTSRQSFAGVDLNAYGGYGSDNRSYANAIDASAETKLTTTSMLYGAQALFFLKKLPLGLGVEYSGESSSGKKDDVKYNVSTSKLSLIIKLWKPGKGRVQPFATLKYVVSGSENYTLTPDVSDPTLGDVSEAFKCTMTGYGADLGLRIIIKSKFYIFLAGSWSADTAIATTESFSSSAVGDSTGDAVDGSKFTTTTRAALLGAGVVLGAGK